MWKLCSKSESAQVCFSSMSVSWGDILGKLCTNPHGKASPVAYKCRSQQCQCSRLPGKAWLNTEQLYTPLSITKVWTKTSLCYLTQDGKLIVRWQQLSTFTHHSPSQKSGKKLHYVISLKMRNWLSDGSSWVHLVLTHQEVHLSKRTNINARKTSKVFRRRTAIIVVIWSL